MIKKNKIKNILYVTYDGLTDQLGQSQILPYLEISKIYNLNFIIISFEKKKNINKLKNKVNIKLKNYRIKWYPLYFSSGFGKISKIWDLIKMSIMIIYISNTNKINIFHGRGHIASSIGFIFKKIFNYKLLFDFRGLWIEERIDNQSLKTNNLIDNFFIKLFKKIENKALYHSDHIVVLTSKIKNEIYKKNNIKKNIITIIPCATDYKKFNKTNFSKRIYLRKKLNINPNSFLLSYIGSISNLYMLDEMLDFFIILSEIKKNTYFQIITRNIEEVKQVLSKKIYSKIEKLILLKTLSREEINKHLNLSDVSISFIKPSYAGIARFPTKISESFASGVPVISNDIGDMKNLIRSLKVGFIIKKFNKNEYLRIAKLLTKNNNIKANKVRKNTKELFNLNLAKQKYLEIYNKILNI